METNKKFIGYWNKSVILTYIGIVASIVGSVALLKNNSLKTALTCLIIAGICDMFDGTVARMCKRTDNEKEFGVQIDSLADMICSIAFPLTIFIHSVELNTNIRQTVNSEVLTIIIASTYAVCGIARLAWFNINTANTEKKVTHYTGLPVTFIALIFPIIHLIGFAFDLCNLTYYITILITSILFIGNFKLVKPGKVTYIVLVILAIISSIAIQFIIK